MKLKWSQETHGAYHKAEHNGNIYKIFKSEDGQYPVNINGKRILIANSLEGAKVTCEIRKDNKNGQTVQRMRG
ncbi:MAG: hypothetical protein KAS04_04095 [Candidatus Aenigmarchaeota archaeon]|nr:hypothetical protein [Candidatus Aenigmarchaeota archaeon]